jgi:hypothetical protein
MHGKTPKAVYEKVQTVSARINLQNEKEVCNTHRADRSRYTYLQLLWSPLFRPATAPKCARWKVGLRIRVDGDSPLIDKPDSKEARTYFAQIEL